MADRYRVLLSSHAAARMRELHPQHRGRLTQLLTSLAVGGLSGGLFALRSWAHLAACESLPDRRVIVVYAIVGRVELEAELFGKELAEEFRARDWARLMHGRR